MNELLILAQSVDGYDVTGTTLWSIITALGKTGAVMVVIVGIFKMAQGLLTGNLPKIGKVLIQTMVVAGLLANLTMFPKFIDLGAKVVNWGMELIPGGDVVEADADQA